MSICWTVTYFKHRHMFQGIRNDPRGLVPGTTHESQKLANPCPNPVTEIDIDTPNSLNRLLRIEPLQRAPARVRLRVRRPPLPAQGRHAGLAEAATSGRVEGVRGVESLRATHRRHKSDGDRANEAGSSSRCHGALLAQARRPLDAILPDLQLLE